MFTVKGRFCIPPFSIFNTKKDLTRGGSGGRQSLTGEKERMIKVEPLCSVSLFRPWSLRCGIDGGANVCNTRCLSCGMEFRWHIHTHTYNSVTGYLFWHCLSTNKAKSTGRTYPSSMADNIVSTAAGGLRLTLASLLAGLLSDEAAELAWLALAS